MAEQRWLHEIIKDTELTRLYIKDIINTLYFWECVLILRGENGMGLRKKFFVLAGLAGLLMAIVSIVGYFTAYNALEESVEGELRETVEAQSKQLDGW